MLRLPRLQQKRDVGAHPVAVVAMRVDLDDRRRPRSESIWVPHGPATARPRSSTVTPVERRTGARRRGGRGAGRLRSRDRVRLGDARRRCLRRARPAGRGRSVGHLRQLVRHGRPGGCGRARGRRPRRRSRRRAATGRAAPPRASAPAARARRPRRPTRDPLGRREAGERPRPSAGGSAAARPARCGPMPMRIGGPAGRPRSPMGRACRPRRRRARRRGAAPSCAPTAVGAPEVALAGARGSMIQLHEVRRRRVLRASARRRRSRPAPPAAARSRPTGRGRCARGRAGRR